MKYYPRGLDGLIDHTVSFLVRLDYYNEATGWGDSFYCLYAGLPWQQEITEESLIDEEDALRAELEYANSISVAKATELAETGDYHLSVISRTGDPYDLFYTD